MTREEILDRAINLVKKYTAQNQGENFDNGGDICEICSADADHEPEETVYVDGQYRELGIFTCSECHDAIEAEISAGEDISEVENVVYLENFR